jgi:hypothetical protein
MSFPAGTPAIKPSRFVRALVDMDPPFIQTRKGGTVPHKRVDWRALERNKYAPWGIGHAAVPL